MIKLSELKKYDIYHIENIALLREHYKKAVFSPDRQHKAQIYFEYDCQGTGTYVDFTNKKGELLQRVQFTPCGWSVICKSVGDIIWLSNETIRIYNIQVERVDKGADSNTKYYWLISINGQVEYNCARADNPHLLFELGKKFCEGKMILENKEKGLSLIRQSAKLNYKHAENWLKRNSYEI
jgi:hypothetical protein